MPHVGTGHLCSKSFTTNRFAILMVSVSDQQMFDFNVCQSEICCSYSVLPEFHLSHDFLQASTG